MDNTNTWLTGVLAILALLQALIYFSIRDDTRTVERAYVDLSHAPPGLTVQPDATDSRTVQYWMVLTNNGRTPADIVAVSMRLVVGSELPDEPSYGLRQDMNFVVMPTQSVNWSDNISVASGLWQQVEAGQASAWLVGYVDYRDRFRRMHRGGYARHYSPGVSNNLIFESKSGYNYDLALSDFPMV